LGEPNWPNLPQMPPTQLLPKRRGQLAPTYAFARHLAIGVGMDGQRPCRTLAEDPGRTQPRAAYPRAAAQTRVVSLGGIRLRSWESARVFKGIICADVSEFESYMPSHAVGLHAPVLFEGRPAASSANMQPEPVRGGHKDAREAPIWVGPWPVLPKVTADPAVSRSTLHIDDAAPHIPLAAQALGSVRDARLMLRLSRRLRPVGGCRCFNALQIRSQGRVLHVFLLRALGLDRR
jgi:hypothetical protein